MATEYWENYVKILPTEVYKKYNRWQDQHSFVIGRLLLMQGLTEIGCDKNLINELKYNQYGKPLLTGNFDFNIAHSGGYVVCAIGKNMRLGVDVETIADIQFDHFKSVMTKRQWLVINNSENPLKTFYTLWTIKESIIKAEGKGLSIPLLDIRINKNSAQYKGNLWFLKQIRLNSNFCTCLATSIPNPKLEFIEVNFHSEMNKGFFD